MLKGIKKGIIVAGLSLSVFSASLGTSFGVGEASAATKPVSTYKVVSGDTLYKISTKYKVSVSNLKKWNRLSTTTIKKGQTLKLKAPIPAAVRTAQKMSIEYYTVVSGDTLYRVATKNGISVSKLQEINKLTTASIKVGQRLIVSTTDRSEVTTPVVPVIVSDNQKIIDEAKKHLGTPYAWGGIKPGGFDCSGFVYYVLNKSGHPTIRTNAEGYFNKYKATSTPKVGDLVFFANTYKAGISHIGIYMGDNKFINAADNGVEISTISGYWASKFAGFRSIN